MLFVLFRSAKCVLENGPDNCTVNNMCATWISFTLAFFWGVKAIHKSIQSDWRKDLSISMEQVAKMKISWRRTAEGILLVAMALCGAFLFALMSSKNPDKGLVLTLGLTGEERSYEAQ